MPTLITLNEPGHHYAGGIRFAMIGGPVHVSCWVSVEALDRIESGNPSRHDPMVLFDRHRLRIEQLASQRFEAGEQSPIVMTFDV